jgi:hypothetical protein
MVRTRYIGRKEYSTLVVLQSACTDIQDQSPPLFAFKIYHHHYHYEYSNTTCGSNGGRGRKDPIRKPGRNRSGSDGWLDWMDDAASS